MNLEPHGEGRFSVISLGVAAWHSDERTQVTLQLADDNQESPDSPASTSHTIRRFSAAAFALTSEANSLLPIGSSCWLPF